MWIDAAWSARGLAALHAMLDVDDHTRKAMIQFLFDEGFWDAHRLTWDAAVSKWNDGKNPSKPGFFKFGELWALALRFDRHQLFLAVMEDLAYEVRRTPTEERRQLLLERMTAAVESCEQTLNTTRTELARLRLSTGPRDATARSSDAAPLRFSRDDDMPTGGF
jgi:hypothetical protein